MNHSLAISEHIYPICHNIYLDTCSYIRVGATHYVVCNFLSTPSLIYSNKWDGLLVEDGCLRENSATIQNQTNGDVSPTRRE